MNVWLDIPLAYRDFDIAKIRYTLETYMACKYL